MPVRHLVYVIFVVSGLTGLTYQIIWARWLGLVFGSTTTSVSIVLSSFMLGLALGSWLAGRRLPHCASPLRAYGWLELCIGSFAIAFPGFAAATDFAFIQLVSVDSPVAWSLGVRAVLAFVVLSIPTTLMGATLPLLVEFSRRDRSPGVVWKAGLLYGANALGAALGTVVVSFVSIELIGIQNTTLIAASLNLLIGVWAVRVGSGCAPQEVPCESAGPATGATRLAFGVLAASGGAALASEVLWTRTVEGLVGNSTYALAILLVVYLAGIALGSATVSLVVKRLKGLPLWLAGTQLGSAGWMLASIALFYAFASALRPLGGQAISPSLLLLIYLAPSVILFPLGFLSGAVFPIATRMIDPGSEDASGQRIGLAYAWNTLGAVVGGLTGGFLIAPQLDLFQGIYALVVLYAATAAIVALVVVSGLVGSASVKASVALASVALVVTVLGSVRVGDADQFGRRLTASRPGVQLLFHETGLQGITSVLSVKGEQGPARALLVNLTGMTSRVTDTKMMAHVPMLLHPEPEDTLVIGFGMGTTFRSAISHQGNVTVVELVDEVLDAFPYFYEDAESVRAYARGRMLVNDGRNFLKLTLDRYDVITVDPPPPIDGAGVNHLYSLDFLALARSHLKPGGLMAHWIPLPGTLAGVDDWDTFAMLLRTFAEAFPYTLGIPSGDKIGVHVVGSLGPIRVSPDSIRERLRLPEVARDVNEWDAVTDAYFNRARPLDRAALATRFLVTDDRPNLEFGWIRAWRTGADRAMRRILW